MVDSSPLGVERARHLFAHNPEVEVIENLVTAENVNNMLGDHNVPKEVDLFSIDIDSYDFWLLESLDFGICSPRILALEYNPYFGPTRRVTIPNNGLRPDAPKGYHGASLGAMEKLAGEKGYRLVACEDLGSNAFFLRNDLAPPVPGLSAVQAYRPARNRADPFSEEERRIDIYQLIEQLNLPLVEV